MGQQWRHPWEIVLVDNCSTDQLTHIVPDLRSSIPLYTDDGPGVSAPVASLRELNVGNRQCPFRCDRHLRCGQRDSARLGGGNGRSAAETRRSGRPDRYAKTQSRLATGHFRSPSSANVPCKPVFIPPTSRTRAAEISQSVARSITLSADSTRQFPYLFDTKYCWRLHQAGVRLQYVAEGTVHIGFTRHFARHLCTVSELVAVGSVGGEKSSAASAAGMVALAGLRARRGLPC